MLKRFISSSVAILFAIALIPALSFAQDTLGIGEATYVDQNNAIVLGESDFFPGQPTTKFAILSDEFGNVTEAVVDLDTDGSFVMFASNQIINGSTSFVVGTFIEPGTGELSGDFSIVVETEFEKWFKKWRKVLDGITDPPDGRPCLYQYDPHLKENFEDIEMETGDYFPHWDDYGNFDDHNKPFIEALVAEGEPVRDTFLNPDGTIKPGTAGSTIEKERDILRAGGYEFDQTDGQWEK